MGLRDTHYYIKNNKDLLYSTWNDSQYLIIAYNGKESEKLYIYIYTYTHTSIYIYIYTHTHTHTHTHIHKSICICITESFYYIPETNASL